MTTLALVGNPNSGKSTLFNALTKSHQRIGNWPGVTVERTSGWFNYQNRRIEVIDLPGLYDLEPPDAESGLDERIVRDFIQQHQADVFVNVVDATSLDRGLFLTTQLRELDIPVVVVLTMMDVARRNHTRINVEYLREKLGCPVIPVTAKRNK
ncbi:MAG: 50S ribosome-binding GTPase, partial [Gammaproteobacteria bacterium]|nr:50S ribosome-binding GTPase [Gammaproteobacteria bacterium]